MLTTRTIQEAVVEQLRDAIIGGVYKPGQRLKQLELARRIGCSPIPIREALHRLAAEGFVIFDPQRGARITHFSSRELKEMYEVRIVLERLAAQRAAERMTAEAAQRIQVILDKMDAPDISPVKWVRLNWEFHDSLFACADQDFLRKTVSNLRRNMEPYLRLDIAQLANYTAGRRDHRRIFRACLRHDGEAAARYAAAHLKRTANGLIKYVRAHWTSDAAQMPTISGAIRVHLCEHAKLRPQESRPGIHTPPGARHVRCAPDTSAPCGHHKSPPSPKRPPLPLEPANDHLLVPSAEHPTSG